MSNERPTTLEQYGGSVPVWNRIPYRYRRLVRKAGFAGIILVSLFIIVFPLYWMFATSIRTTDSIIARNPDVISTAFTTDHYETLFFHSPFLDVYLLNSIIVAIGVVSLTTFLATLGGYGLTRIDIPYKKTFARGVLFGYMFPAILLAIPMFIFWRELGIINTYVGLILAETALALPFSLWLMWKFFQTVPYSLEESAQMNGATRFRAFVDVALPMAKPGIIAVAVFSFAVAWNEFTMPKILMPDPDMYVITVGLETFVLQHNVLWGQLMAASFVTIIPAFMFVYLLQKYLLRGFRAGGVG